MKNRNLLAPILCAVALSFVAGSPGLSEAQTAAPGPAYPAPTAKAAPPTTTTGPAVAPSTARHTIAYTVVAGDSLTGIAKKFNTTRKRLEALNNLAGNKVTPGQVLLIPSTKTPKSVAAAAKAKTHHDYLMAQPVQDFDVPASTFASCPVPLPSPEDDPDSTAPAATEKPAPVAKLVSPAELEAEERKAAPEVTILTPTTPAPAPAAPVARTAGAPNSPAKHLAKTAPVLPAPIYSPRVNNPPAPLPFTPPAPRLTARGLNPVANPASPTVAASNDWGNRFLQTARVLGNQGIEYDDDWRPPGESHSWVMDCSNTSRYIYKVTAGIQLPRTASDQYYYLHLQGKAWDVPQAADGWADANFLRHHLKPGDLLFWENTYRPERQPPITHVMVFLGTNAQGQWIMAGSQSSRGGEHNRRNGGPDVYVFRPSQPCGGYTTWMGFVHHRGRFCAFGRPLEADPNKLSVAEND
jgi:cell wall-associated NlpC family hydrolase